MNAHGPTVRGESIVIFVDGRSLEAKLGQTVGAALLAQGIRVLRHTRKLGKPRGLFCAMGICYDCVLSVDGQPGMRACMTPVHAGMQIIVPKRFADERNEL